MRNLLLGAGLVLALANGWAQTTAPAPAKGPVKKTVRGTYVHAPTRISFPERTDFFKRGEVCWFDDRGCDISVDYYSGMADTPCKASIYVYPIPEKMAASPIDLVRVHFDQVLAVAKQGLVNVELLKREPCELQVGTNHLAGLKAVLRFEGQYRTGKTTMRTEAYVARYHDWFVKWRVTYPEAADPVCSNAVHTLLAAPGVRAIPPPPPAPPTPPTH